jgi:hypothetical protein
MKSPIVLEDLKNSAVHANFHRVASAKEPLTLIYSGPLEYVGYFRQTAICHLDVYNGPQLSDPPAEPQTWVFIATEVPDNKGLSITNGIEKVAQAAEGMFGLGHVFGNSDEKKGSYFLVEHYSPSSYEGRDGEDDYSIMSFREEKGSSVRYYGSPDWIPVEKEQIERLIGGPLG